MVCTDCRLVQEAAERCRSCAGRSLRTPSELQHRPVIPLELVDWRSMPAPLMLVCLAALLALVMLGPALVRLAALLLTGSAVIAELALVTVLLVPSVRMLFRAELPLPPEPRLLPAAPRLLLKPSGQVRRGRVRALSTEPVVTLVRACDRRGTYLWRIHSVEFEVLGDHGALRVCGSLALDGKAEHLEAPPLSLPLAVGRLESIVLSDGDEVELRGPLQREQAAAGYRDTAEIEVMRGVPGNPVEIVLHPRRGPA